MLYAKLTEKGAVEKYPYTLSELKLDNPSVSFPSVIDEQTLSNFNVVSVTPSEQPSFLYNKIFVRTAVQSSDGTYVEEWGYEDAEPSHVLARTESEAAAVRVRRNQLLAGSDWTQLYDAPVDSAAWADYRQALRDLTKQAGFPWEITWPTEPA